MPVSTPERPWHSWYGLKRWANRKHYQLTNHPLCSMCLAKNIVTPARVADHVIRHNGNAELFWFGELQSLCFECHSSTKAQLENKGYVNDIGDDGFPIDRGHPFNRRD